MISIVCLSDRAFDATPTHCSISSVPSDCIQYDDVECIKGERAYIYQWAFLGVPCWITFGTIIFIMLSIVHMQMKQESRNSVYQFRRNSMTGQESAPQESSFKNNIMTFFQKCLPIKSLAAEEEEENISPLQQELMRRASRASHASQRRKRVVVTQAYLYICAFFIGQVFFFSAAIMNQKEGGATFAALLLREIFYPLQGLLNVYVYTHQHVASLRRCNPGHSWFSAFLSIIRNGGDHDELARWRQMRRSAIAVSFDSDSRSRDTSCWGFFGRYKDFVQNRKSKKMPDFQKNPTSRSRLHKTTCR